MQGAEEAASVFEVMIDDDVQTAVFDGEGGLLVFVPAFGSETSRWPTAPDAPLDIKILRDGSVVATLEDALTVEPLEEAPLALEEVVTDLEDLHEAMTALLDGLAPADAPGEWSAYQQAFGDALGSLFDPSDESSFAQVLAGIGDDERLLLGSILASTPIPDRIQRLRAVAEAAREASEAVGAPARAGANDVDDLDLAIYMQKRAIFEATVGSFYEAGAAVASEANRYAAAFGLSSVLKRFQVVAIVAAAISAHFTIYDIFINDFLIPMMPANVDALTVSLAESDLRPGEPTAASFEIVVSNTPSTITLNQIVNAVLNVLGVIAGGSGGPANYVVDLEELIVHVFTEFQGSLTSFSTSNPDVPLDVDVIHVPLRTWHATIDDARLLDVLSGDDDLVARSARDELEWTAASDGFGETDVLAVPSQDPEAIIFDDLTTQTAVAMSAFGTDRPPSNGVHVRVRPDLEMTAELPAEVQEGEPADLVVRARYVGFEGATSAASDVSISLTVAGGILAESTGDTDAEGIFRTTALIAEGEERLTIDVHAEGALGATADQTVEAFAGLAGRVELQDAYVRAAADYGFSLGWLDPISVGDHKRSVEHLEGLGDTRIHVMLDTTFVYAGETVDASSEIDAVGGVSTEEDGFAIDGFFSGQTATSSGEEFASKSEAYANAGMTSTSRSRDGYA